VEEGRTTGWREFRAERNRIEGSRTIGVTRNIYALQKSMFSAASSRADGVIFNDPTGVIGGTHPYTLDGFTIMASAFNGGSLFGKNDGIGEQGVGLTGDPSGQHEIFEVAPGWRRTTFNSICRV